MQDIDHEHVYEPLVAYKQVYKDKHNENSTKYLEDMILESGIDEGANKTTNKLITKKNKEASKLNKQISRQNGLRIFLFFLIKVGFILAFYGIYNLSQFGYTALDLGFIIGGLLSGFGFIVLIFKKVNPGLKKLKESSTKLSVEISDLMKEAWAQLQPLNNLFKPGINIELFKQTLPLINLDAIFDSKRLDYLINRFGMEPITSLDSSTLYVRSGDINGNPFYLSNNLVHTLGTKTYTGSKTVTYTTTRRVNGRLVTQTQTQILTASVNKPYPYYEEVPYLVYGNDAAPDLSFTRTDSDAEHMDEKQINKFVSKKIKKLEKKSEKSISKGQGYTVLGHSEFEVLFGATNRDHEVQFRLLFTPLAQKQLLQLMKEKEIGFGDDFVFIKDKKINIIMPDHLKKIDLTVPHTYFHDYNIDVLKERFINYQNSYFKHVFFTFAPVLSIPLYQQQKPQEYIYKDLYDSYLSFYEHEAVANQMNQESFKNPLSQTRNILKTSTVKSGEFQDKVKVTSYGYKTVNRVDYQTQFGRDGRMHTIPIPWVEFIPVEQVSEISIDIPKEDKKLTPAEYFKNMIERLKNNDVNPKDVYLIGTLVAHINKKQQDNKKQKENKKN